MISIIKKQLEYISDKVNELKEITEDTPAADEARKGLSYLIAAQANNIYKSMGQEPISVITNGVLRYELVEDMVKKTTDYYHL